MKECTNIEKTEVCTRPDPGFSYWGKEKTCSNKRKDIDIATRVFYTPLGHLPFIPVFYIRIPMLEHIPKTKQVMTSLSLFSL